MLAKTSSNPPEKLTNYSWLKCKIQLTKTADKNYWQETADTLVNLHVKLEKNKMINSLKSYLNQKKLRLFKVPSWARSFSNPQSCIAAVKKSVPWFCITSGIRLSEPKREKAVVLSFFPQKRMWQPKKSIFFPSKKFASKMSSRKNNNKNQNDSHEKHSAAIREFQSSFPENKKCFECEQRGPTYVDMTIGSFVCTKCSGMLWVCFLFTFCFCFRSVKFFVPKWKKLASRCEKLVFEYFRGLEWNDKL